MKKTLLLLSLFTFSSLTTYAKTSPAISESQPQTQTSYETITSSSLTNDAATIGRVRIESYAAPHVLSVNVIKMFRGKGNPQKYMGGWLEGKNYSVDISGRAWKKTWDEMTPKYDPLGKEVVIFVANSGQLEGMGEIKDGKILLFCARASQLCKVEPAEIPLASLKVEKPL